MPRRNNSKGSSASRGNAGERGVAERTYEALEGAEPRHASLEEDYAARALSVGANDAGTGSASAAAPAPRHAATDGLTMADIFGPGGMLEKCHPGYEYRRSQLEMAELVDAAFREKRHAVVEAGTGTGKTLAYLIPAIRSGRRVVVSTATKSLQEQLFNKDIPFLQKYFARELKVAVMKGRNNFLCRQKVHLMKDQPVLRGLDEVDWFAQIRDWAELTETGDRAELTFLPDDADLWPRLDARRDTCTGQKCPDFNRCFITWMHQRAREADIIIVNHHLFFADLALRQDDFGSILPDYTAVIFDEAHEIEDVAGNYFGRQVSNYRFEELARDVEHALRIKGLGAPPLLKRVNKLRERSREFFDTLPGKEGRFPFTAAERASFVEQHAAAFDALVDATKRVEAELSALPQKPEELTRLARRAFELRNELQFLLESKEKNFVYWFERRGKGVFLAATPIDLSPILRERLFGKFDTLVLTSATLAVGGRFDYLKQRLGMDQSVERVLPQDYDYKTQAVLYVPRTMPDVRSPDFAAAAAETIARLVEITDGRAFCLFTSYAQMREIHERVSRMVDFPLLLQGTGPRSALLEKFRNTEGAVLFATATFWQGVDVPGDQLSCVIIDRLPFAVPSDPVVAARVAALQEEGRNAFAEYQVPEAVLALKQGFGRLIRSRTDRGVLALLDNRILRMHYGRVFFESLPPYTVTHDLAAVSKFMSNKENTMTNRRFFSLWILCSLALTGCDSGAKTEAPQPKKESSFSKKIQCGQMLSRVDNSISGPQKRNEPGVLPLNPVAFYSRNLDTCLLITRYMYTKPVKGNFDGFASVDDLLTGENLENSFFELKTDSAAFNDYPKTMKQKYGAP